MSRRLSGFILETNNHTVVLASDGAQALAQLDRRSFDLIMTDLSMPAMDGITFLRSVRACACHATVPIIVLTASAYNHDREYAARAGASAFLTKPASSEDIVAMVETLLAQHTMDHMKFVSATELRMNLVNRR